ncbi:hypothetical protein [Sulfurospirillum barnesii]|uniref:Uncharacterized protein n=1 Tax=Sulfurospirillum barnesii (strain ATCC 700032 / DSM 10660 / SES-3) TaxID=760154 RepID=I3Y0E0_SULBS|nr:hypothetical protein [Sulfurospirillum barnesii]AFL69664.1 hypothetical protein Sulba_2397 [Sulfurospirillum barnesii SES-3]
MEDLKNKVILVSIRTILEDGTEAKEVYFGKIISYNLNTVCVTKQNNNEEITLPYFEDLFEHAEEGFYELEDGSTCENPDYIARFVKYVNEATFEKFQDCNQPTRD